MNLRILVSAFALMAIGCVTAGSALAAEGGTIKGRFVYDGKPPAPKAIAIVGADAAFCGKPEHKKLLVDESLVLGKDGALANVFFYMQKKPAGEVHPYYKAKLKETVVLDNMGCRFQPHVAALWTEQTITIGNKDSIGHNTKIDGLNGKSINPLIPPGGSIVETFKVAERLPILVGCNLHTWMNSRLLIQDHPYFAITDAEGNFEIKHVPAGAHEFRAYHEDLLYLKKVKIGGKEVPWEKGIVKVKIEEGKTLDLGEVHVPAK